MRMAWGAAYFCGGLLVATAGWLGFAFWYDGKLRRQDKEARSAEYARKLEAYRAERELGRRHAEQHREDMAWVASWKGQGT